MIVNILTVARRKVLIFPISAGGCLVERGRPYAPSAEPFIKWRVEIHRQLDCYDFSLDRESMRLLFAFVALAISFLFNLIRGGIFSLGEFYLFKYLYLLFRLSLCREVYIFCVVLQSFLVLLKILTGYLAPILYRLDPLFRF